MTTTSAQLPNPWSLSFDGDTNYCSAGVDAALDDLEAGDLTEDQRDGLLRMDDYDAHSELLDLARDAEVDADENDDAAYERAERLRDAAGRLDYCRDGCTCAADAWDDDKANFDQALQELSGEHQWSIVEDGYHRTRTYPDRQDLDIEALADLVSTRYRPDSYELTWDGTVLTVVFNGRDVGHRTLVCTPLLDPQLIEAAEVWEQSDPYNESLATEVLRADRTRLAHAVRLWKAADDPEATFGEFAKLLDALETVDADTLDTEVVTVAERLAGTWHASVADLLSVANGILVSAGTHEFAAA